MQSEAEIFGAVLKAARQEAGLTVEALAEQDSEVDALIRKLAACDGRAIKVAKATIQSLIDTAPKES